MGAAVDHSESGSTSNGFGADSRTAALEIELRSVRELFLVEAQRTAHLQQDLSGARLELMRKDALLNETNERSAAAQQELKRAHREVVGKLRAAAEEARGEAAHISEGFTADLDSKNRIIHSLRRSIGDVLSVQERAQRRAEAAEATVVSLRDEIGRLEVELDRARAASVDLVGVLQAGLATAQGNVESLHRELAELRAAKDSLEETLDGVLTSRSWRLTRPMRWVLRALRGGRGRGR